MSASSTTCTYYYYYQRQQRRRVYLLVSLIHNNRLRGLVLIHSFVRSMMSEMRMMSELKSVAVACNDTAVFLIGGNVNR